MPERVGHAHVASFTGSFGGTSVIEHGVRLITVDEDLYPVEFADLSPNQCELLAAHLLWRAALMRYEAGEPGARKPRSRYTKNHGDVIGATLARAVAAVPLTERRRPNA